MMGPTHAFFGIVAAGPFIAMAPTPLRLPMLCVAALSALVPDIDEPQSTIGRLFGPISGLWKRFLGHRTLSHSVWALLACMAIGAAVTVASAKATGLWLGLAATAGWASHIMGDIMTKQGVKLFWPDPKTYALGWFRTGKVAEDFAMVFLGIGAVIVGGYAIVTWIVIR